MTSCQNKNSSSMQSDEFFLLSSLKDIFPSLESFTIGTKIVQANATGYILDLAYNNPSTLQDGPHNVPIDLSPRPSRVFCKHVESHAYSTTTKQNWNDLRRTLVYIRTEVRLYRDFAPMLKKAGFSAIPRHYMAQDYGLTDWISETEAATAPVDPSISISDLPTTATVDSQEKRRGGLLVLECMDDNLYFQDSPITVEQSKECLYAAASLHVAAWENVSLLKNANNLLSKASFHLDTRNPTELAEIEHAWENFYGHFHDSAPIMQSSSVRKLGARIAASAGYISNEVSPIPTDAYATIVHGDFKAMNVFLPKRNDSMGNAAESSGQAILVDFASTGIGLGMSDVAMHIHHALLPTDLEDGGEMDLVRFYWKSLTSSLGNSTTYPWDVAVRQYKLCVVDYFRFLLGRFWKTASAESMVKKAHSKNTCLLNRSEQAAMAYVKRVDEYLNEIEHRRGND